MRIWSKELIEVLPKKQLMAMRYELGDMIKQYPNIKHGLVKFANDYDISYLGVYFADVVFECRRRKIKMNESYHDEIVKIIDEKTNLGFSLYDKYTFNEDNKEYLKICLMNLYEKHIRGIITKEELQKIEDKFGGVM